MGADDNGWKEHSRLVLSELKRLNIHYENISKDIKKIYIEIAILKVKGGIFAVIFGLIGGTLPVISFVLLKIFLR